MTAAYLSSLFTQFFPPKPTFSPEKDIPDLTGKVIIVTGGSSGIGLETVKVLLQHNATVYIAARDATRSLACIEELKKTTGKEAKFLELNLASLKSVKTFSEEFLRKEEKLDVLMHNAGLAPYKMELLTEEGYDLLFGTHVIGPFYLTELLLPALQKAASSSPHGKSRVLHVSSVLHYWGALNFDGFKDGPARNKISLPGLYAQSKYGMIVYSNELARKYGDEGIVSIAVNPGNLKTPVWRNASLFERIFVAPFLYPAPLGALTQLWASTSPEALNLNGKYVIPWARVGVPSAGTEDVKLGKDLWLWLEEQVANFERSGSDTGATALA